MGGGSGGDAGASVSGAVGGSAGSNRPIGGAGRGGSAGKAGSAGSGSAGSAGAGESGEAGSPSMGVGGSAGEPAGTGGATSEGGTAGVHEGEAGAGAEGGEPAGPQPELLWSYVVTASSQNPDLDGRSGTHRMSILLDGDRARPCINLSWTVAPGETGSRTATQQELLALQDCLTFDNADTWVVQARDPAFILNEEHTFEPPPNRSIWVLTEARVNIVENTWEWEGTRLRDEWELWGYPR